MIDFQGTASRRSPQSIADAAETMGCDEAAVRAVIQVEARGQGFDSKGRPLALFEPHVFYRCLSGAKQKRAVELGIAYKDWKPNAYPRDSYPRIAQAVQIDEAAALKATSWGLPQILGENYREAGFNSPAEMVEEFANGEDEQIAAMARFIVSKRLHKHLQSRSWAKFALGYNGPGYKKNSYDQKLERAYLKFSGGPVGFMQPDDIGDDGRAGNSTEPMRPGIFAKVRNWLSGVAGFGGLAYFTDWQIAAVIFLGLFLIGAATVFFIIMFFGADNVRAWVRKQVW